MNGQRSEIPENGWIEIEDQALETGPNEVETPSRVNGASHGAEGRFLSGTSPATVSSSLSDDECTTVRRDRSRYRVASILSDEHSGSPFPGRRISPWP